MIEAKIASNRARIPTATVRQRSAYLQLRKGTVALLRSGLVLLAETKDVVP